MVRLSSLVICAAFTLSLWGCAASKIALLNERSDALNQNLRWSNLSSAAAALDSTHKTTLMEKLARQMEQEKIVDYAIMDLGLAENQREASVIVEFTCYGIVDQNVRKRRELQSWTYSPKKKNWFLSATRDLTRSTMQH